MSTDIQPHVGVLVVDDEDDIRFLAQAIVERANHELYFAGCATSGAEALEAAHTLDPAVVVLDLMMPGMDGIETATRLRAARPRQKILLFTAASVSREVEERAASVGISAIVAKNAFATLPDAIRTAAATC